MNFPTKFETNCKHCKTSMADLVLDPALSARACVACSEELRSFEATFELLDSWHAPAPSPYFDQRLAVRLREMQAAPAAGWFERLRTHLQLNTGRQLRPALTLALAAVIIVGGGTAADLSSRHSSHSIFSPKPSAAVNDLQLLDKNAQALQTMDQLFQDETTHDDSAAPPLT